MFFISFKFVPRGTFSTMDVLNKDLFHVEQLTSEINQQYVDVGRADSRYPRSLSDGRRADSRQFLSGFDRKRSQFAVIEIRSDPDIFESRHFVGDVPFALDLSVIFDLDFGFFDHFLRTPVFKNEIGQFGQVFRQSVQRDFIA